MDEMSITKHGHTLAVEWRDNDDGWRPGWWAFIDGAERAIPIGSLADQDANRDPGKVLAEAAEEYIGDPPPSDHAQIWGGYKCGPCGAGGVQLWRDYQTVLEGQTLRCQSCCEAHAGKAKRKGGDQIGWHVPAVPTPDGSTFWGYTSVPVAAIGWWKALASKAGES